jgi:hypothetical protein
MGMKFLELSSRVIGQLTAAVDQSKAATRRVLNKCYLYAANENTSQCQLSQ